MFDISKIYSHKKELCHDVDMNENYMISTVCNSVPINQDLVPSPIIIALVPKIRRHLDSNFIFNLLFI